MNFLIAVVNESYENCMTKMEAQQLKVKLDMISDHEEMMSKEDLESYIYFPKYILIRSESDNKGDKQNQQWQGFVKEIIKAQERQI